MKKVTIYNLKDSTKQEVFDFISHHLLTQNEKSMIDFDDFNSPKCLYHGLNGLSCAAGCLIPKEFDTEELEHEDWIDVCVKLEGEISGIFRHSKLIGDLQIVHDMKNVELWSDALFQVAEKYHLKNYE